MRALLLALLTMACASSTPPPVVRIVERPVYVYVPEKSGPPVPPGEGIAPSPLLLEAERRRADAYERRAAEVPQPAPEVVYVDNYDRTPFYGSGLGYGYGASHYGNSTPKPPETTVIIVDDGHDHRQKGRVPHVDHHKSSGTKNRAERAASRCSGRATEWARKRCYAKVTK